MKCLFGHRNQTVVPGPWKLRIAETRIVEDRWRTCTFLLAGFSGLCASGDTLFALQAHHSVIWYSMITVRRTGQILIWMLSTVSALMCWASFPFRLGLHPQFGDFRIHLAECKALLALEDLWSDRIKRPLECQGVPVAYRACRACFMLFRLSASLSLAAELNRCGSVGPSDQSAPSIYARMWEAFHPVPTYPPGMRLWYIISGSFCYFCKYCVPDPSSIASGQWELAISTA